jgi:hypothetical protein
MTMFTTILSTLGEAAKQAAALVVPGAGPAIKAGEAILAAFHSVKTLNGNYAPPDAEAAHDALFAKVKAHADSTLGRLEG